MKGVEIAIDLGVEPRDDAIKKGVFGDTTLLFNHANFAMAGITTTDDSTCDSLKNPKVSNHCNASAYLYYVFKDRVSFGYNTVRSCLLGEFDNWPDLDELETQ